MRSLSGDCHLAATGADLKISTAVGRDGKFRITLVFSRRSDDIKLTFSIAASIIGLVGSEEFSGRAPRM